MKTQEESDFKNRQSQFSSKLKLHDDQHRAFLNDHAIEHIESCFEMVFTHNSFGLPCFRLKVRAGILVPTEIKKKAQIVFKRCLGDYAI